VWPNPVIYPGGILDEIHRVEPSNDTGLNEEQENVTVIGSPLATNHVV